MTSTEKIVYILLGETGLGKSSLVCMNCPDVNPEIIGDGVISTTKKFEMYKQNDYTFWIDTMGTNDYENKISNEDILRQFMFGLNKKFPNGISIKILWFIAAGVRCKNDFQVQAKFIQSLSSDKKQNPFNSTLIIVKNSYLDPMNDCYGALHAAHLSGAPTSNKTDGNGTKLADVSAIGYTILEALTPHDNLYRHRNSNARKEFGIYSKQEIKQLVLSKLNKLSELKRKFTNSKCKKCGIEGDKDFVPLRCHTVSMEIHPTKSKIHTGSISYKHKGTDTYHSGSIVHYHDGHKTKTESGSEIYESSKSNVYCGNGHHIRYKREIVTDGTFNCKYGCTIYEGENMYECGTCQPNNFNFKFEGERAFRAAYWCEKHTETRNVLKTRKTYKQVYSCCKWEIGAQGCKSKMSCCDKEITSKGCKYTCCDNETTSNGCQGFWDCCKSKEEEKKPCSWECCEESIYTANPCKKICQNCRKDWGTTEGCGIENRSHDM